jgi:hypothetical protein
LAEVRPWLGQYISLARFVANKDLILMSLFTPDPREGFYFIEPEPREREIAVWADIDRAFAKPVARDDKTVDYVPTQVIAELFKSQGFDGIAYRSALGEGENIALFDLASADPARNTLWVLKNIKSDFREIRSG